MEFVDLLLLWSIDEDELRLATCECFQMSTHCDRFLRRGWEDAMASWEGEAAKLKVLKVGGKRSSCLQL
jgi:hypothetical protein